MTPLAVQAPGGDFVLNDTMRPLLLVTGGAGITPAMCMLESSAASGRPIHFIHPALHGGVQDFRQRADELAAKPRASEVPHIAGQINSELMVQHLPHDRDVDVYFIGPKPFIQTIYRISRDLGVQPDRLRHEFFGPKEVIA